VIGSAFGGGPRAAKTPQPAVAARRSRWLSWRRPGAPEVTMVVRSALAAGLSWFIAAVASGTDEPLLAPFTALVVVQLTVSASVRSALQRTLAVVLGVLVASALGSRIDLNGLTVALIVGLCLAFGSLVLQLPVAAARQVPITVIVVLASASASELGAGWWRAVDTVIGAAIGAVVSMLLPASRLVDAKRALIDLATSVADLLDSMGAGLQAPWTAAQTARWREHAYDNRHHLTAGAAACIVDGREAARWNFRDRRNLSELERCDELFVWLQRTTGGVSSIARDLDEQVHVVEGPHEAAPEIGSLLTAVAVAVRATAAHATGVPNAEVVAGAIADVRAQQRQCLTHSVRPARIEAATDPSGVARSDWIAEIATIVHVGRIVADLDTTVG
jgi:uncharacterized membrane protein YgaE (UPF0421/DUF939 family)